MIKKQVDTNSQNILINRWLVIITAILLLISAVAGYNMLHHSMSDCEKKLYEKLYEREHPNLKE